VRAFLFFWFGRKFKIEKPGAIHVPPIFELHVYRRRKP
jgi:hypothetical protein